MRLPDLIEPEASAERLAAFGAALRQHLAASGAGDAALGAVFDGAVQTPADFHAVLGQPVTDGLLSYGVLQQANPDAVQALFSLRSLDGLLIVTDLPRPHLNVPENYVDPLWEGPGLSRLLDVPAGGLALDMGTGCGVLALTMARTARQVYAVDVNPRALILTRFNAGLNGLTNVTVLASDLFSAVGGMRFDLVAFNSPTGEEFTNDSLQHSGEAILERFFREVPAHLADTGSVQISLCGKDWIGETFMARIERFLGAHAGRYQFVFLENWRTVRGRIFFLRRLSASLRLGINAFRCKAFMKGWLVMRPGIAADSVQVSTDYHDWTASEPPGTAAALIRALQSPATGPTAHLPERLRGLPGQATRIARQAAAPLS